MRSRGFTLIELLAVIVILAIIALIAVPIVLNIINNAKEEAKVRSAENYLDAVNQAVATYQMKKPQTLLSGIYQVMENGNLCQGTVNGNVCTGDNHIEIPINIDGEKIMPKTITFDTNGTMSGVTGLTINNTEYSYSNGKLIKGATNPSPGTSGSYTAYTMHQEVTISGELFYVLKDSDSNTEMITLLASKHIDVSTLQQTDSYSAVVFCDSSVSRYWDKGLGSGYYDIEEPDVIPETHTAAYIANQYGEKFGGTGRLITHTEAHNFIGPGYNPETSVVHRGSTWLATATGGEGISSWNTAGETTLDETDTSCILPVIEISKSVISN